jgi:hypothetical protein
MGYKKPGEPFRQALIRVFHPDHSLLWEKLKKYLCFGGSPDASLIG